MTSPTYSRFDDESTYRSALQSVLMQAEKDLCILDRSLAGMRMESVAARDVLASFLARGQTQTLRIALHDISQLRSQMPRMLALALRYAHTLTVRQIPDEYRHLADCHLLADRQHGVRRFHADHPRGALILDDPQEIRPWWARFDDLWDQSAPIDLTGVAGL